MVIFHSYIELPTLFGRESQCYIPALYRILHLNCFPNNLLTYLWCMHVIRMYIRTCGRTYGWTDVCMHGWMDGWMDMNEWIKESRNQGMYVYVHVHMSMYVKQTMFTTWMYIQYSYISYVMHNCRGCAFAQVKKYSSVLPGWVPLTGPFWTRTAARFIKEYHARIPNSPNNPKYPRSHAVRRK